MLIRPEEMGAGVGCDDADEMLEWLNYDMPLHDAYRKCAPGWWPVLDRIWKLVENYNERIQGTDQEIVRIKRAYRYRGMFIVNVLPRFPLTSQIINLLGEMTESCEVCGAEQAELWGYFDHAARIKGRPRVLCEPCHTKLKTPSIPSRLGKLLEELDRSCDSQSVAKPVAYPWDDEPWFPGKDQRDDEIDQEPPEWWKLEDP